MVSLAFTSFLGAIFLLPASIYAPRVITPLALLVGKAFDNGSWFGGIGQALFFSFIAYLTIFITLHTLIGISFRFIYSSIQAHGSQLNRVETILYSALSSSGSYLLVMSFWLFSASLNTNAPNYLSRNLSWLIPEALIGLPFAILSGAAGGWLIVRWRTKVRKARSS